MATFNMADESKESLALFARPQSTYTGDPEYPGVEESNVEPLPLRHSSIQGEGHEGDDFDEPETEMFSDFLGQVHEKALTAAGFGRLQWTLFVVLGLGIMGDGIELLIVAFVLPGAERELCMNSEMKGWLGAIAFAGMMVGAVLWGNMADRVGRRMTLITALLINALFSIVAAFVPTYWLFLVCRLLSGVGIGGSIPIVFAYFAEFCPLHGRGQKLGLILMFWVMGGVYVAGLGWLIIPRSYLQFTLTEGYVFGSWRVFMLLCTIPILLSLIGLAAMPESPRFLLQVGRDLDALEVYHRVYRWNHCEEGAVYEMPEIELPSRPPKPLDENPPHGICEELCRGMENFWNSFFQLFFPPLTKVTLLLCVTWFSIAFGYYGLTIWFPEYMKKLQQEEYFARRELIPNVTIANKVYEGILDNMDYYNATFVNVTFRDIILQHVSFEMSVMRYCTFQNVSALQTYFTDSILRDTTFNSTNFYPYKFIRTLLKDVTLENTFQGCNVDFDLSVSTETIFLENFMGQLAVIPGTLLTAVLVDRVGRVRMLTVSLFLSGVGVFFIWFTDTEVAVVAINCIFNFIIVGAWNSLDIISTELYPTQLRTTAFGFQSSLGRIAAIMGNVAFGQFINVSKAIPILLTASIMMFGGLLTHQLPESKNRLM